MVIRLPKPQLLLGLEYADDCLHRLIEGLERAVFILGPQGVGKDAMVRRVFDEAGVSLRAIQDATLFGFRAALMRDPHGYFWLNDYDGWLYDPNYLNFLKNALEPDGDRLIGASNAVTLGRAARGQGGLPNVWRLKVALLSPRIPTSLRCGKTCSSMSWW